jgi:hypothetical protein
VIGTVPLFFGPDGTIIREPEDVICFLGKGKEHWKVGRSAYEAAHSWFAANDLPLSIRNILYNSEGFEDAVLERAIFENKTRLDDYGRDSQTDILAFLKTSTGRAILGVEAKVDETFGQLVSEWNDYGTGKLRRLVCLLNRLEFKFARIGSLRYQLFHRVAATLIEAEKAGIEHAAMIVQSFDLNGCGFSDFSAFAEAFETPVDAPGKLSPPRRLGRVTIRVGWTKNPLFPVQT